MKKLIVIGIIAMMITGLSVVANASVGTVLNLQVNYEGGSWQPVQMGWYSDNGSGVATVNGTDSRDVNSDLSINDNVMQMFIPTIGTTAGTWVGDFRAPDVNAQTVTKIWRLSNTLDNVEHTAAPYGLTAWFTPGFGPGNTNFYIFQGGSTDISLAQMKAAATAGTGYVAMLSVANTAGTEYNSPISWTLPAPTSHLVVDPDTGDQFVSWDPYTTQNFTVYAEGVPTVPEPGSMLALFSGLVGLVGFGIRRRK